MLINNGFSILQYGFCKKKKIIKFMGDFIWSWKNFKIVTNFWGCWQWHLHFKIKFQWNLLKYLGEIFWPIRAQVNLHNDVYHLTYLHEQKPLWQTVKVNCKISGKKKKKKKKINF